MSGRCQYVAREIGMAKRTEAEVIGVDSVIIPCLFWPWLGDPEIGLDGAGSGRWRHGEVSE